MTTYLELPPVAIADGRHAFAEHVAAVAAAALGIPTPRIRWFTKGDRPDAWALHAWDDTRDLIGQAYSDSLGEIWVCDGLRRSLLANVVAHEVHHDAWHRRCGPGWYSAAEAEHRESSADAFAARLANEWRF